MQLYADRVQWERELRSQKLFRGRPKPNLEVPPRDAIVLLELFFQLVGAKYYSFQLKKSPKEIIFEQTVIDVL